MNNVDLIIIFVIVITVLLGYRKSFVRSFTDWVSVSVSLWFTLHNFGGFTKFIDKIPGINSIVNLIDVNLLSKLSSLDKEMDFSISSFENMNFSKTLLYFFKKSSLFSTSESVTFSQLSIGLFKNMISVIVLFIICSFILKAIFGSFEYVNKMAGFNTYQRAGSILFSFLKSIVYVTLIAFLVFNIASFFNSGILYDAYHSSTLAKILYNNGLIEWVFGV